MKKIRLTESELTDIIKKIISEQPESKKKGFDYVRAADDALTPKPITTRMGPPQLTGYREIYRPLTIDSSLFLNGVDKINTQSTAYIEAINAIATAKDKLKPNETLNVSVTGGASAVGSRTFGKEQNLALANRRAENFIKSVKKVHPDVNFIKKEGVVGRETSKGDAANKEQFVKIEFNVLSGKAPIYTAAIDNTETIIKTKQYLDYVIRTTPIITKQEKEKLNKGKFITMCAEIPVGLEVEVQKFLDKIGGRLKSGGGYIGPRPGQMPGLNFK